METRARSIMMLLYVLRIFVKAFQFPAAGKCLKSVLGSTNSASAEAEEHLIVATVSRTVVTNCCDFRCFWGERKTSTRISPTTRAGTIGVRYNNGEYKYSSHSFSCSLSRSRFLFCLLHYSTQMCLIFSSKNRI